MKVLDIHAQISVSLQEFTSERLRLSLDAAQMGVWEVFFPDMRIVWDESYGKLFGLALGEYPTNERAFLELVHPDDRPLVLRDFHQAVESRGDYVSLFRIVWPNDEIRWHSVRGRLIVGADGSPIRMIGVGYDVTNLKRLEDLNVQKSQRLDCLEESLPAVVWMVNRYGECTFVNRKWSEWTGQSATEALGLGWLSPVHKADRIKFGRIISEPSFRDPFELEIRLADVHTNYRWALVMGYPVFAPDGSFVGHSGCILDTTEIRNLRQQIEHLQRLDSIGSLAAGVAHEFNNILSVILGLAHSLFEMNVPTVSSVATRIQDACKDANHFTRRLLSLQSPKTSGTHVVMVSDTVNKIVEYCQKAIPKGISINVDSKMTNGFVKMSECELSQVLMNLILNACDAMPSGGRIAIAISKEESHLIGQRRIACESVVILVSDTGVGISEKHIDRVFDAFFTTKDPARGSGLGLAVSQGIVSRAGGSMEVVSDKCGTTFTIKLPLIGRHKNTIGHPIGVIVVSECDYFRVRLTAELRRNGYQVAAMSDPGCLGELNNAEKTMYGFLMIESSQFVRIVASEWVSLRDRYPECRLIFIDPNAYSADDPMMEAAITELVSGLKG